MACATTTSRATNEPRPAPSGLVEVVVPPLRVVSSASAEASAAAAASDMAAHLEEALVLHGRATLALSGGTSPLGLYGKLAAASLDWPRVEIFQVDERWVSATSPHRNLASIVQVLGPTGAFIRGFSVNEAADAAGRDVLRRRDDAMVGRALFPGIAFDVVHLGLGSDGHTASWPSGRAGEHLRETHESVVMVNGFNGHDRTTLTPRVVNRAEHVVWFVHGISKEPMLRRLVAGDESIPAGWVRSGTATVFTDLMLT